MSSNTRCQRLLEWISPGTIAFVPVSNLGVFPLTKWLWRRLSSRRACLIYIALVVILASIGIAFHVQSMFFARRVNRLVTALSSLKTGVTSRAEALSLLPELTFTRPVDGLFDVCNPRYVDKAEKCSYLIIDSRATDGLFGLINKVSDYTSPYLTDDTYLSVLKYWGFRYYLFIVRVQFREGKVSDFGYSLAISGPGYKSSELIHADVYCSKHLSEIGQDESPHYRVIHPTPWPESGITVDFTSHTPNELLQHAFHLRLKCMWLSFAGCKEANQVLPEAENDRLRMENAASQSTNRRPRQVLPSALRIFPWYTKADVPCGRGFSRHWGSII